MNLSRQGIENLIKLENRKELWIVVLYAHCARYVKWWKLRFLNWRISCVKVAKFRTDGDQKEFSKRQLQLGSFPMIRVPKELIKTNQVSIREERCWKLEWRWRKSLRFSIKSFWLLYSCGVRKPYPFVKLLALWWYEQFFKHRSLWYGLIQYSSLKMQKKVKEKVSEDYNPIVKDSKHGKAK